MYNLKLLSVEQVKKVYHERMTNDFPSDELKPYDMLCKLIEKGLYDCYGIIENDEIIGYTFLNRLEDRGDYLIDYLATLPDRRNKGLGALILKLLSEKLADADSIIGEVENPEYAENIEDKEIQTRRYNFYLRNNFRDTNVRVSCFGVPFILIELGDSRGKSEEDIKELYKLHYKAMLPKELYDANVLV